MMVGHGHMALTWLTYVAPLCRKSQLLPSSNVVSPPFDTKNKKVATRPTQTLTTTPKLPTPQPLSQNPNPSTTSTPTTHSQYAHKCIHKCTLRYPCNNTIPTTLSQHSDLVPNPISQMWPTNMSKANKESRYFTKCCSELHSPSYYSRWVEICNDHGVL